MAAANGAEPGLGAEPPAGPEPAAEPPAGPERVPEEELPPLEPEEVRRRLEHSERQFGNRRKVLIRGLPADVTNQDIHELLKDYELKYCFVDKHKGTAFVTLLNASQASSALRALQGLSLRHHPLLLQLQPPQAVLCVSNLPLLLNQQQFQHLVRPFGNLERCFLIYNPQSGHSKGYGFVEFTRKDSAARAKAELLGRRLGARTLFVRWVDEEEMRQEGLHSRCLCVEGLPRGYRDLQGLREIFQRISEPVFCQLAHGQDGQPLGFAVLQFRSPEEAERAQAGTDGLCLAGGRVRVSFCAPGPAGPAMLAALTAAHGSAQNRGQGLLPEPNILQILRSLGNPLVLNPLLHGALGGKQGILGAAPPLPLLPRPALLPLALQNPGILGDSPRGSLAPPPRKLLREIPKGAPLPGEGTPKPKLGESGAPKESLLGEPPRIARIPRNPFLNLRRVLPPGAAGERRAFGAAGKGKFGILGPPRVPPPEFALDFPKDLGSRIFPQGRDPPGFGNKLPSPSLPVPSPPFLGSPPVPPFFSGSPRSCFSSGVRAGLRQSRLGKTIPIPPSSDSLLASTPPSSHPKHKRSFGRLLPEPEPSPEGSYVGQHSQGLGGHYADSYLKRKRIF